MVLTMSAADRITAIGTRGEEIKTNSAEYLWPCRGIKPLMLADKPPVVTADDERQWHLDDLQLQLQARLLDGSARLKRK